MHARRPGDLRGELPERRLEPVDVALPDLRRELLRAGDELQLLREPGLRLLLLGQARRALGNPRARPALERGGRGRVGDDDLGSGGETAPILMVGGGGPSSEAGGDWKTLARSAAAPLAA